MSKRSYVVKLRAAVSVAVLLIGGALYQTQAAPMLDPCSSGGCTLIGIYSGNDKSSGPDKSLLVDAQSGVDLHLVPVDSGESFAAANMPGSGGNFMVTSASDHLSGTWSYSTGTIDYVSIKAGNNWALYAYDPGASAGLWSTQGLLVGNNQNQAQLSHLTFWSEAAPAPVPEPGALLLLGTGLAGLFGYRWRQRRESV